MFGSKNIANLFIFFILLFVTLVNGSDDVDDNVAVNLNENTEFKIIETNSGSVRGKRETTLFLQRPYYSFKGIPYAQPPVGQLRFKPPVAKKPWKDIRDAFEFGQVCYQRTLATNRIYGSEDCLFLNVYTPGVSAHEKLAVIIYIHGGGYVENSANDDLIGPDFLINENVILVSMNFRLNIFGFLSFNTAEYSGNMGLKDQQLAIKWVKKNIEKFGGDPEKITLVGHSSGSASTHFHVLNSDNKGLFKRAIALSGTALNPWSIYEKKEHLLYMFGLSKKVKESVYDAKQLIEFVKSVKAEDIFKFIDPRPNPHETETDVGLIWAPVIENAKAKSRYIKNHPDELVEEYNGDVDMMFGFTSSEMLFTMGKYFANPDLLEPMNTKFDISIPTMKLKEFKQDPEYTNLLNEVKDFYFGKDVLVNNDTLPQVVQLLSDVYMNYGIDRAAKKFAEKSTGKTFYYKFSIEGRLNLMKMLFKLSSYPGATHGDELCYIFRCKVIPNFYENLAKDSLEMEVIQTMTKLYADFAKYGNPMPGGVPVLLEPIKKDVVNYVDITNDGLYERVNPNSETYNFWDNLIKKYNNIFVQNNKLKDEL